MTKLLESSVFQFSVIILAISACVILFSDDKSLKWIDWLKEAVYFVGIYAGKEGIRYGSKAYSYREDGIRRE